MRLLGGVCLNRGSERMVERVLRPQSMVPIILTLVLIITIIVIFNYFMFYHIIYYHYYWHIQSSW